MNPLIEYKGHTSKESDGFYHPGHPLLYNHSDTIGSVINCPFPLVTDTFTVRLYGTFTTPHDPKHGTDGKFIVVEYVKKCGHRVEERIPFLENVETFEHHGTVFTGESYSIANWKNRIEHFRMNQGCDVCNLVHHCLWHYAIGDHCSRKQCLDRCRLLLDANYLNWDQFVPWSEIERRVASTVRGSDKIVD